MRRKYNDVMETRAADRQRLAVQFINEAREAALIREIPRSEALIAAVPIYLPHKVLADSVKTTMSASAPV